MKILDWYNHQGHQYEFFKLNHNFSLLGRGGVLPNWNKKTRPFHKNVKEVCIEDVYREKFDVVMYRNGGRKRWIDRFVRGGAAAIAVVQTTTPPEIPKYVRHVVWNSKVSMNKFKQKIKHAEHFYIPHGFDPNEFVKKDIKREKNILSVVNCFKLRSKLLGFSNWERVSSVVPCKLIGHGNEDISKNIKEADSFESLINIYNSSYAYLNTTTESAMPRSRAEAMMCGLPIITTNNYDISKYLDHKKTCLFANSYQEMIECSKMILDNDDLRLELSEKSRECAIKHFNIKDYLDKWNNVISLI